MCTAKDFMDLSQKFYLQKILPTKMLTCMYRNFTCKKFCPQKFYLPKFYLQKFDPHVKIAWLSAHITTYKLLYNKKIKKHLKCKKM